MLKGMKFFSLFVKKLIKFVQTFNYIYVSLLKKYLYSDPVDQPGLGTMFSYIESWIKELLMDRP
jgi:hypothetical protein